MGYYSRLIGSIGIRPALSAAEIADSPVKYFEIADDGTGLDFHTDEGKYYNIEEHLQEFVDHYPTHAFSGTICVYGEDATDIWRMKVSSTITKIDTTVTKEEAVIRWPDGSVVESIY
jgi:hypothetical protein